MQRSFKTKPKDPLEIRSSSINLEGMKRAKRVKIAAPETINLHNSKPDASSVQYEATKAKRSDAPKTSEYAFFKKMKENSCSNSHMMHNKDIQLKNAESSDCTRETPHKKSDKYVRFSLPIERTRPDTGYSFLSPPCDGSNNSELNDMLGLSSVKVDKVKPGKRQWLSPPTESTSKNSGSKGVFSAKREKLRQWVANTSLPGVNELCSNGFNLVSVLLSRLYPEANENSCRRDPMLKQVEIDTKDELPPFSESDTAEKGHQTQARNLIEPEHRSYLDDYFSRWPIENSCHSGPMFWKVETDTKDEPTPIEVHQTQTRNLIEPEHRSYLDDSYSRWPIKNRCQRDPMLWQVKMDTKEELHLFSESDAPVNGQQIQIRNLNESEHSSYLNDCFSKWSYGHGDIDLLEWNTAHSQYRYSRSLDLIDGWRIPSLFSENSSSFDEYFQRYASGHLEGLHKLQVDDEPGLREQPHPLLLGWDVDSEKDKTEVSALWALPSFSNTYPNFTFLPPYHVDSCGIHELGRHLELEEGNYLGPLTLSCTPKQSFELRPRDYTWCENEVLNEKDHFGVESFPFTTRLANGLGWKFLSAADSFEGQDCTDDVLRCLQNKLPDLFLLREEAEVKFPYSSNCLTHLSEDRVNYQNWSLTNCELPHEQQIGQMGCHLLLDNSIKDNSDEELYRDIYDEDEWKYA